MKVACVRIQDQVCKNAERDWAITKDAIITAGNTHDLLVLPKCVYPTYFLSLHTKPVKTFLDEIRTICKETNTYIVFGYADGEYNIVSMFNRNGEEIARQERSSVRQFDKTRLKLETNTAIAKTEYGRIALVLGEDTIFPEFIRSVTVENVQLVICLSNLRAAEPYTDNLTHTQCEYMISTRARENNVWFAVFDKWGIESNTITPAGRLAVYQPDGTCISPIPLNSNMILSVEIPTDPSGEIICESDESIPDRRPELYSLLNKDTHELPVYRILSESVIPESLTPYVTVSCYNDDSFNFSEHIRLLKQLNPNLIILPTSGRTLENPDFYQKELGSEQLLILSDSMAGTVRSRILAKNRIYGEYRTVHNSASKDTNLFPVVVNSPFGNIGIIHEGEALIPESVRCVMLAGADLIVWPHGMPFKKALPLAQTRAAENRIFVAGVYSSVLPASAPSGASFIIDPNGNLIAVTSVTDPNHTTGLFCSLLNARIKSIIPGTHVVFNRNPKNYGRLVSDETTKV